jgi:hypothetical protein
LQIYYNFLTIKYSNTGIQQWIRAFNPDTTAYSAYVSNSITVDNTGNIYVAGTGSASFADPRTFCTVKYSSVGDLIWVRKDTAEIAGGGVLMDIDKNNNIYIAGSFSLPSPYYRNITIIKYDSTSKQQWRLLYGNTGGSPGPSCLHVDKNFNIYVAGSDSARMCSIKYSQPVKVIHNNKQIPDCFKLFKNYPNPFNSSTRIKFDISSNRKNETLNVKLIIFDILGREVTTLLSEKLKPGSYQIKFDGSNYPSGIYFYTLINEDHRDTKKMVLIK